MRKMRHIECMLCVLILTVVLLSLLTFTAGVLKALTSDAPGSLHHRDPHYKVHHVATAAAAAPPVRRKHGKKSLPGELRTLELLKQHKNHHAAMALQSDWLPGVERKRVSSLAMMNPFNNETEVEAVRTGSTHSLDLRRHKRISDDTYFLGTHAHPHDASIELESYAFVHYAPSRIATPSAHMTDIERSEKHRHFNRSSDIDTLRVRRSAKEGGELLIECGAPIAMGARWRSSRGYFVHPHNSGGLDLKTVVAEIEAAADTWRCVFRSIHLEPMGPLLGVIDGNSDNIDFHKPTGDNRVAFAKLRMPDGAEDQTLAVTISHGRYGGPHGKRYIAEFSTVFNDDYTFANCADGHSRCEANHMLDFQSIATHELGHAHGLDDLYSSKCTGATMYWNAQPGEIKKRSLTEDDRNSMIALYHEQ